MQSGKFIVFEGVEGCGKSTQIKLCQNWLEKQNVPCIATKEPGGTIMGEKIRKILLDPCEEILDPIAELELFVADRIQHVNKKIKPMLNAGVWVLCDRFHLSTLAYQGAGRGIDETLLKERVSFSLQGIKPDLILWFHIDPANGLKRKGEERDRIEAEDIEFYYRVAREYKNLHFSSENSISINGDRAVENVAKEVQSAISANLPVFSNIAF